MILLHIDNKNYQKAFHVPLLLDRTFQHLEYEHPTYNYDLTIFDPKSGILMHLNLSLIRIAKQLQNNFAIITDS